MSIHTNSPTSSVPSLSGNDSPPEETYQLDNGPTHREHLRAAQHAAMIVLAGEAFGVPLQRAMDAFRTRSPSEGGVLTFTQAVTINEPLHVIPL